MYSMPSTVESSWYEHILLCTARRKGDSKRWICPAVRPSVRPSIQSVAYISNHWRSRRPSVPEFGKKVPHLWCNSHTSFKVKKSNIMVTRPINADTHRAPYIFRTARPMNFKLGTRMEDDDPHQPQAPWPPRSKVKVTRSRNQSEPSWPNAVPVSLAADGGIPCRANPAATLLVKNIWLCPGCSVARLPYCSWRNCIALYLD